MKYEYCHEDCKNMYQEMDILLLQDGGCAPGYNPVTAFLVDELEQIGRSVFIAHEGFKSLVSGQDTDFHRLVYRKYLYQTLEHISGVIHAAPLSEDRGAAFRSERFKEFKEERNQQIAAKTIQNRNIKAIIAIGGNGTFFGIRDLGRFLNPEVQLFFIPVTIDSDVSHTECIGQHTGVEVGAEKIRCYMADARTHKRIYIVEMMGASGGFHALHSCLGARAHLAVIPGADFDIRKIAQKLSEREEAVIVVAEGYKESEREQQAFKGNAAEFFREEILETGIPIKNRIVCEPFSRDIRGASPNNIDITLCQQMAFNTVKYLREGKSKVMASVNSGQSSLVPFTQIDTENHITHEFFKLTNRLTETE